MIQYVMHKAGPLNALQKLLLVSGALLLSGFISILDRPKLPAGTWAYHRYRFTADSNFSTHDSHVALRLRSLINYCLLLAVSVCCPGAMHAQPGSVDLSFNPTDTGAYIRRTVRTILYQPDGKIVVAGGNPGVNSGFLPLLARYHKNGSFDSSFSSGTGCNGAINALVLLPDGRILVGGSFSMYGQDSVHGLLRINSDGSIDRSFRAAAVPEQIYTLALQSDEKLLAGGSDGVIRLNPDGSVDSSFEKFNDYNSWIYALAIQPDGKIILAGHYCGMVRLHPDGSRDQSFAANVDQINSLVLQADGKIVVGGNFSDYGLPGKYLVRLFPDGRADSSYRTSASAPVRSLISQADGKIIAAGYASAELVRLNTDGTEDASFQVGKGFRDDAGGGFGGNGVLALCVQQDGRILTGGDFFWCQGKARSGIARILPDGGLDTSFKVGTSFRGFINSIAVQTNGKIIVGGNFDSYYGMPYSHMARLNPDGSPDSSFHPTFNSEVHAVVIQPDGKILAGGAFTGCNGRRCNNIARLNEDGTLDISFHTGSGFQSATPTTFVYGLTGLLLQRDSSILAYGYFGFYNGQPRNCLVRLNHDGSLDTSFSNFFDGNYFLRSGSVALSADGRILIGGGFPDFSGVGVIALRPDGKPDPGFHSAIPGTDKNSWLQKLEVDQRGNILVSAAISYGQGVVYRLLPDGRVDPGFSTSGEDFFAIQPDGKFLEQTPSGIRRYSRNGLPDTAFAAEPHSFSIHCAAFQTNGYILLGGYAAETFGLKVKNGIYRLQNCIVSAHPAPLQRATQGTAYSGDIFSFKPDSSLILSVMEGSLPPGLSLSSRTGRLSGIPVTAGHYRFTIRAESGECSDSFTYDLYVDSVNKDILVYPIPSTGQVTIRFGLSRPGAYDIRIFDLPGKVVYSGRANVTGSLDVMNLDLSDLARGCYVMQIAGPDKTMVCKLQML